MGWDGQWKSIYIRLYKRDYILMMMIYLFLVGIPNYYVSTTTIPDENDLLISKGIIVLKKTGKRVRVIGINESGVIKYFSCATRYSGSKVLCGTGFSLDSQIKKTEGKDAVIHWFEQPLYGPIFTRKRIVSIRIEGKVVISYNQTKERVLSSAKWAPYYAGVLLVFFVLIIIFYEFARGKRD